ncbi:MAG: SURF1 family protein [Corynebacterium sp.]|nr:SURF1 family protein [Corynebacterium sp.]
MRHTNTTRPTWWATFLKPGWVLFALFVVVFSYLAFTVLAPWQLGKDADIVERNHQLEAAYSHDPLPYEEVFSADGTLAPDREWARITLSGQYVPQEEVLLRLRPVASGPAYQSLVPFRTQEGHVILINRGWVAAGEGNVVPSDLPAAPEGEVTISGFARLAEAEHPNPPVHEDGYTQVYSISPPQISQLVQEPSMFAGYVQLADASRGVLNPIPIPSMDRGNHLSYGYQWIAFGIMAPLGLGYFAWSEMRERRRAAAEDAELAAAESGVSSEPHSAQPTTSVQTSAKAQPSTRRRARYGSSHPNYYDKLATKDTDRA